ncbi:ATP-binding protein [Desulfobacterales bacterium HSG2]|nr:ATP-binding protein [Desulfobacterales bacterium HSG2]
MLIRFTVENFLSFNQRTDFNMIASAEANHPYHVVKGKSEEEIGLLRTAILYGANASGKSNLIKAINFARDFIIEGVGKNKNIRAENFKLDKNCYEKPSRFEFEFRYKGKQYAYGFLVDKTKVCEEWLFEIGRQLEVPVFERNGSRVVFNFQHDIFSNISDEDKQILSYEVRGTRKNLLFLTNCQERNIAHFKTAYEWFDTVLEIITPKSELLSLLFFTETDKNITDSFEDILDFFGFRIKRIDIKETDFEKFDGMPKKRKERIKEDFPNADEKKEGIGIFSVRNGIIKRDDSGLLKLLKLTTIRDDKEGNEVIFEMSEESDGTRRVIYLIPMLMALLKGKVFIIDEIENSLHPLLMEKLFDLILNNKRFKDSESQLIASTHQVHLLDIKKLFRKDEIWFIEKNRNGESLAYSLANTDVEDLDLVKGYLNGRFGAIPFIRDVKELGWEA